MGGSITANGSCGAASR